MIPGELMTDPGSHEINVGRREITLVVQNTGDRPIQVGSHYHFAETNAALGFDRQAAQGMRLNIAAGTAIRFEPGQQRTVALVDYAGDRLVYGFRGLTQGALDNPPAITSERHESHGSNRKACLRRNVRSNGG